MRRRSAPGPPGIEVIDLDTNELSSNDREIFEVVAKHVLVDPLELEFEVPEDATSAATTSANAGATSNGALMSGAIVSEQPTLN
jgi:hypothetical protein